MDCASSYIKNRSRTLNICLSLSYWCYYHGHEPVWNGKYKNNCHVKSGKSGILRWNVTCHVIRWNMCPTDGNRSAGRAPWNRPTPPPNPSMESPGACQSISQGSGLWVDATLPSVFIVNNKMLWFSKLIFQQFPRSMCFFTYFLWRHI